DSDATVRHLLHETLLTMGAGKIISFQDGQEAWEWLDSNDEPSLIIQEWRLPKISGNVLVQRARNKGLSRVPIVIYSSLVKATDALLLREMGVTEVIEKPLSKKLLTATLNSCLEREHYPSDPDGMV